MTNQDANVFDSVAGGVGGIILMLLIVLVGFVFYFLPLAIAITKSRKNTAAIAVLNIFAGWTFIGWIVALVWAITDDK